ncbi:MAG: hypothetical protein ACREOO_25420 [bacterium]
MKQNCIVLTGGLTGSSVLTSLIARAGYWTGDNTFKKQDYDTYENQELIKLNRKLIDESGYKGNYIMEFANEPIRLISGMHENIDQRPYVSFMENCNNHRPWVWKDPRLWLTIRFWKNFLDLNTVKFILLTRDNLQMWISATLRRQIQSYEFCKNCSDGIVQSFIDFCGENSQPYLHLLYDDLILHPEPTIAKLNEHLDTELALEDLRTVYRNPLYKMPRSTGKFVKAGLIYLKNYSVRYK